MELIEGILSRNALGKLSLPAPSAAQLNTAFSCGLRAPDHQVLRPWRFLVVQGAALEQMGDVFVAAACADDSNLAADKIEKLKKMPLRAPLIVVAITAFKADEKVPAEEQLLSTGAAVQNFILALHAQGFTSMWRTGPMSSHQKVCAALGLQTHERIAGFIYVGTANADVKKITPLAVSDFVQPWPLKNSTV